MQLGGERGIALHIAAGDVVVIPAGVSQSIRNPGPRDLVFHCVCTPRFTPDIILSSGTQSLDKYGVPATILHTPGHTAGSISVVFEDGRAIVGDLAMNGLPSSPFKPTPPIVAQDPSLLPKSWTGIREFGAKTIFPGHGKSFDWLSLAQDYGIME